MSRIAPILLDRSIAADHPYPHDFRKSPFKKLRARLLHIDQIEPLTDEQLRRLFDQARACEHQPIVRGCREVAPQLDRHRAAPRPGCHQDEGRGIKRELDRVGATD
jgi:hypothetical protein